MACLLYEKFSRTLVFCSCFVKVALFVGQILNYKIIFILERREYEDRYHNINNHLISYVWQNSSFASSPIYNLDPIHMHLVRRLLNNKVHSSGSILCCSLTGPLLHNVGPHGSRLLLHIRFILLLSLTPATNAPLGVSDYMNH